MVHDKGKDREYEEGTQFFVGVGGTKEGRNPAKEVEEDFRNFKHKGESPPRVPLLVGNPETIH